MTNRILIALITVVVVLLLINYTTEPYNKSETRCTKCNFNTHEVPLTNNIRTNLMTDIMQDTNTFDPNVQCGGYKDRSSCIIAAFKDPNTNGFQASVVCNTCA